MKTEQIENLIAATLYLMSRHSAKPSSDVAIKIVHHLAMLLEQEPVQDSQVLRKTVVSLLAQWRKRVRGIQPRETGPNSRISAYIH